MRDINRIPIIIKRLAEVWMKNPDLRLGQLIMNVQFRLNQKKIHMYKIEDDKFIMELGEMYDQDNR